MTTRQVWTEGYRPFVMGGIPRYALVATVQAQGPFDLGKGVEGWLVTAPNGSTHVAVGTTGAFVGRTVDEVRSDIEDTDQEVIDRQMKEAEAYFGLDVVEVTHNEFWSRMKETGDKAVSR